MTDHHYIYLVRCRDDSLYTGYTVDVEARVAAHNAGHGAKYTKARRPVELVAWTELPTKHDALVCEAAIKRLSRPEKLALVALFEKDAERFHGAVMMRWVTVSQDTEEDPPAEG